MSISHNSALPSGVEPGEDGLPIPATTTQSKRLALLRGPDHWWKFPMARAYSYPGRVDVSRLEHALRLVARRHNALRTYFLEDQPIDTVGCLAPGDAIWPLHEMTAGSDVAIANAEAYALLQQQFSPYERPLLRAVVLHRPDDDLIGLSLEHSIFDPASATVLLDDLAEVYDGLADKPASAFDRLVSSAARFAHDERAWLGSDAGGKSALAWWDELNEGLGAYPGLDLPDLGRCEPFAPYIDCDIPLSFDDMTRLRKNAAGLRLTTSMYASAASALTLRAHGNSPDVRFLFATSRRVWPEMRKLVAYCSNRMMLRVPVDTHDSIASLAPKIRSQTLEAVGRSIFSHEEYVRARFPDAYERQPTTYGYLNVISQTPAPHLGGRQLKKESLPVTPGDYHQPGIALALYLYDNGTGMLNASCAEGMYERKFVESFLRTLARYCVGGAA